jgi:hypothetical protein
MSFFSQVIVLRLGDFLLNKSLLARHRRKLLAGANGDVLGIGFGTGQGNALWSGHRLRLFRVTLSTRPNGFQRFPQASTW